MILKWTYLFVVCLLGCILIEIAYANQALQCLSKLGKDDALLVSDFRDKILCKKNEVKKKFQPQLLKFSRPWLLLTVLDYLIDFPPSSIWTQNKTLR